MRRFRIVIFAATLCLVAIVIAGAVVLIVSGNPVLDTAFNIIAISVSAASVVIALVSQISSYKDRKRMSKLINGLHNIDEEVEDDEEVGKAVQQKLDELIALDRELNRKVDRMGRAKKG